MDNAITIRLIGDEDEAAYTALRREFLLVHQPDLTPEVLEEAIRHGSDYFRKYNGREFFTFFAECGGEIAGSASWNTFYRLPYPDNPTGREGYIANVYVRPAYRRRGVATRMVQAIVDHSGKLGFTKLFLHASTDGRPVYAKFGFKDEGTMIFQPTSKW